MSECNIERLKEIFDRGLVSGLRNASSGQVCIEAAISLACGGDLSDSPPCVAAADRAYALSINEAPWSSPQARAEALWPLALAQIGTAGRDRAAWVEALVEGTIRRVLPIVLRAIGLEQEAARCETEGSRAANAAADAARHAADAARHAADAARHAADAARVAAYAADAAVESRDRILHTSIHVALDAYAYATEGDIL